MIDDLKSRLQSSLGSTYTLERELGGGGMSRVFLASDTRLARSVVVKVLSPELAAALSMERFEREIRVAASLQQANIVPLLSAGDADGLPYFTMPFVQGESLRKRLVEGPALTIPETVRILGDVARALAYAHAQGVVHRDIKPDNVLLSAGTAVVTDFGIAKAISASRTGVTGETLTQVGTSIGTPAYMAPEQAAGQPDVDSRADIYAFGCMAYELLTGKPPFAGPAAHKILAAQISQAPLPVDQVNPGVPASLAGLVMQCLAKDPDDRPADAAALARVLDEGGSGSAPALPMDVANWMVMLRRALLLWLVFFAVVLLAARLSITALGLPDWVLPGAGLVMLLGVPVILLTALIHRASHRALTATPTRTPGGSARAPGTLATMAMKASPLVTWRRTTLGGVVSLGVFVLLVAGFMVSRTLGIGPAASLLASGKLSEREALLVADFQTPVTDSALSQVLAEAMRTNLGESRVVAIVSSGAVVAALERMRLPADTALSAELARDLAQREGIKAIVAGSVSPLSAGYVVSARLIAAQSGELLATAQETVDGASELIDATDRLSRRLREKIGESLKLVRADPPLAQVTTSSLEALKKYAEGVRANDVEVDFAKAVHRLREAIAIDSMFGMAYRKLGTAMGNANGLGVLRSTAAERRAVFDRAYELRDRMAERERLLATAGYWASGPHPDRGKAVAAYEALLGRYPDDGPALQNVAQTLHARQEFARAESLYLRRIELDSTVQFAPFNVIPAQLSQGKVDAAKASLARAARLFPGHPRIDQSAATIAYAEGQVDSFAALLQRHRRDTIEVVRDAAAFSLMDLSRRQGKLRQANRELREHRAASPGSRTQDALLDSLDVIAAALWFFDRPDELSRRLDAVLRAHPLSSMTAAGARPYQQLIRLYAAAGKPDKARALLTAFEAEVTDTVQKRLNGWMFDAARARIALAEERYREAIDLFGASQQRPDGPRTACQTCGDPEIGFAFDRMEMADSTIAVYEHYLDTPEPFKWGQDGWELARILRRLGELYEARGDRVKAAGYYQRFVNEWKDADPELQPRVAEIRQRLARLADTERR
jgi:tetratricopeptide (TPR) repeat protein